VQSNRKGGSMRFVRGIIVLVYLLVCVVIANNTTTWRNLHVNGIVSAILAVIL
jgi:hypothetical protein